jgi:hypothetical protein
VVFFFVEWLLHREDLASFVSAFRGGDPGETEPAGP